MLTPELKRTMWNGPLFVFTHDGKHIIALTEAGGDGTYTFLTTTGESVTLKEAAIATVQPCPVGRDRDLLLAAATKAGRIVPYPKTI